MISDPKPADYDAGLLSIRPKVRWNSASIDLQSYNRPVFCRAGQQNLSGSSIVTSSQSGNEVRPSHFRDVHCRVLIGAEQSRVE
jgi:hypothetical protein